MKHKKRTSLWIGAAGLAIGMTLCFVMTQAAEKNNAGDKLELKRIFKFKTSDPNGMNIATQTVFQPGKQAKLKFSVQSESKTNIIEFTVRSVFGGVSLGHSVEMKFLEQLGNGKPEILRQPSLKTLDGVPAEVQMNDFCLEILIAPVK